MGDDNEKLPGPSAGSNYKKAENDKTMKVKADYRLFFFNKDINGWKAEAEKVLCDKRGTLYLIDSETTVETEMEILFMYTQLLYNGYYSDGIAKIGEDMGLMHAYLGPESETYASFRLMNELYDIELYDKYVDHITREGDEMVLNSEALRI